MNAQDRDHPVIYELALLQFRLDATSDEWLNIGAIALDPESYQFEFRITSRYGRLSAAYPDLDGRAFLNLVSRIRERCTDLQRELVKGQQRMFDAPRLASLTERIVLPGSAHFGFSSIRQGACQDLSTRIEEVFEEYVARLERSSTTRHGARSAGRSGATCCFGPEDVERLRDYVGRGPGPRPARDEPA